MKKTTKLSDPNGDTYYEGDYSGTSKSWLSCSRMMWKQRAPGILYSRSSGGDRSFIWGVLPCPKGEKDNVCLIDVISA
jgi:hypothetical protein